MSSIEKVFNFPVEVSNSLEKSRILGHFALVVGPPRADAQYAHAQRGKDGVGIPEGHPTLPMVASKTSDGIARPVG